MSQDPIGALRRDLVAALANFYNGHPDAEQFSMLAEVGRHLTDALEAGGLAAPDPVRLPVAGLLDEIDPRSDVPGVGLVLRACLLYTSPSPRDQRGSRMPSSA